jgi:hypothetical protein
VDALSAGAAPSRSAGRAPAAGESGDRRERADRSGGLGGVALWGLIGAGVLISGVVAFATAGLPYDVQSWRIVRAAFNAHPLHVYALANPGQSFHWPYPSGIFPLMLLAGWVGDAVGGFTHVIRLWGILADGALAWLVWRGLRDRAGEHARLGAAALVALGPVFVTVAGYSAQIDSVAILPTVIALLVWERERSERRAWIAGLLIGLGAAIKTVPIAMVLALAPSVRSRRELAILVGCAVALPLVAMAPFLAADWSKTTGIAHYQGSPGMGGISLLVQPDVARRWLTRIVPFNGPERFLFLDHGGEWNALVFVLYALWAWRRRPEPRRAAVVLWLVVLAFGSGFFFQYLVWGLPFFLLAGYLWPTAALQGLITAPMLIFYVLAWHRPATVYLFTALMLVCWAGWVAGIVVLARGGRAPRTAAAG